MLNRQVLVLNKHWMAVHVCTVKRAVTLLFQELALVVSEDYRTHDFNSWRELSNFADSSAPGGDPRPMLRTPQFQMLLPQVIVLSRYQRCPPRSVQFNRRNIFMRDHYTCQYCGRKPSKDDLTIDHILPKSRGGRTIWENVTLACTACNTKKGSRLLSECGMMPLKVPKRPSWLAMHVPTASDETSSMWQRFIDTAYWESNLRE